MVANASTPRPGQERELLPRWSVETRLVHWALALSFLALLGTGLALGNPGLRGIPLMGSKLVREVHLTWAVLLFVLPTLAASWDGFDQLRSLWRESRQFSRADRTWLRLLTLRAVGQHSDLPPQGRLNAGQKLNVLVLVVLISGLALTGVIIAPEAGRPFPQWLRASVYDAHMWLAYATVPLILGHVFLATVFPATRESARGIVLGRVRASWARAHHALWADEASGRDRG